MYFYRFWDPKFFYGPAQADQGSSPAPMAPRFSETSTSVSTRRQSTLGKSSQVPYRAKMVHSPAPEKDALKKRRLFAWVVWLNPRRWLRRTSRRARLGSTAPVIPPINVGDRLFLESLVRHVEENSFYHNGGGSSAPLMYSGSVGRPSSEFGYNTSPYGAMYTRGSSDVPTTMSECTVTAFDDQPPTYQEHPPQSPAVSQRSNLILLRSVHPPSSYNQGSQGPMNFNHSRKPSVYSRVSTASTSIVDLADYRLSSWSSPNVAGSPLFYGSTPPLALPIPPIPSAQKSRRSSLRLSTQTNRSSIRPAIRSGSITVSIHDEDGSEDLEFPSPPERSSGCWFSERENNQTPRPNYRGDVDEDADHADHELDEDDSESEYGDELNGELFTVSERSEISLGNGSDADESESSYGVEPHAHTFGLGAKSFLSLNHRATIGRVTSRTLTKSTSKSTSVLDYENLNGVDMDDLESLRSVLADVSIQSSGFDYADFPQSDADSFADPHLSHLRV